MGKERLDQILLRKGIVSEDQIKQVLMRQKSRGGFFGSHLLFYKFLSEKQLVNALEEQFGVPGIELRGQSISDEAIKKLPLKLVETQIIFPFKFDQKSRTLFLAMLDPGNTSAISLAKQAAGALEIKTYVAAESVLRNMIHLHYHGKDLHLSVDQIIEFPDIFEEEETSAKQEGSEQVVTPDMIPESRNVLMVTKVVFLKNFLVPIFEREGCMLKILSQHEQILSALNECSFDRILVSEDMEESFYQLIRDGDIGVLPAEISVFSTISRAMLDNPAPYNRIVGSLIKTLQQMAEQRISESIRKPPYESICKDIRDLSDSLGLKRLAIDGLQIASLLLIPARNTNEDHASSRILQLREDFFVDLEESLEMARSLSFPWDIVACLSSFFQLISGKMLPNQSAEVNKESSFSAQILGLVWYRHSAFTKIEKSSEKALSAIKSGLRKKEGRLFSSEMVESYIRLLEQREKEAHAGLRKDVFIMSEPSDVSRQLITHLKQDGYRIVEIKDFSEAQHLYQRQRPNIIVINYDDYSDRAMKFSRFVKQDSPTLLYAIASQNKLSLILSLLDSGFNDVFVPPFNYDIIVARISKALTARVEEEKDSLKQRRFSGTFKELPFTDLIQALAMSQRSIHIKLKRETGESANIYMREGKMTHSKCGEESGAEAIYRIISWLENGSFEISSVSEYPPDNISLPNDFILVEGCRLLDEGKL